MKSTRQQLVLLLFFVLVIISCDKDYNTIGEGLVNEVHFNQVVDSISIIFFVVITLNFLLSDSIIKSSVASE